MNLMVLEARAQHAMGIGILGKDEQAGHLGIQTMDWPQPNPKLLFQCSADDHSLVFGTDSARHRQRTRWLVNHDNPAISIHIRTDFG